MSNRISQILSQWLPLKDEHEWVLGTVIQTSGPCYRKTGAMMMINSLGQWFGLLSGGCLESDLLNHARQVMQKGASQVITYDALDDEEAAWLLGIGCGGKVVILLQPVKASNHYLHLDKIQQQLAQGTNCHYQLDCTESQSCNNQFLDTDSTSDTESDRNALQLVINLKADPLLVIFGAGVDVIPLVNMARELGWRLLIIDHRISPTRQQKYFQGITLISIKPAEIKQYSELMRKLVVCDAAIIMTHNLSLDAEALTLLSKIYSPWKVDQRLNYIGLLGPESRKRKVCMMANLHKAFPENILHGPVGLDIGGELPESIALSILSEIHQVLEKQQSPTFNKEQSNPLIIDNRLVE